MKKKENDYDDEENITKIKHNIINIYKKMMKNKTLL